MKRKDKVKPEDFNFQGSVLEYKPIRFDCKGKGRIKINETELSNDERYRNAKGIVLSMSEYIGVIGKEENYNLWGSIWFIGAESFFRGMLCHAIIKKQSLRNFKDMLSIVKALGMAHEDVIFSSEWESNSRIINGSSADWAHLKFNIKKEPDDIEFVNKILEQVPDELVESLRNPEISQLPIDFEFRQKLQFVKSYDDIDFKNVDAVTYINAIQALNIESAKKGKYDVETFSIDSLIERHEIQNQSKIISEVPEEEKTKEKNEIL